MSRVSLAATLCLFLLLGGLLAPPTQAGPFPAPPPGAPPIALPLPPAAPALGSIFPIPPLGVTELPVPVTSLWVIDLGAAPPVALPGPTAVFSFQDTLGAERVMFRLSADLIAAGWSALVMFGASPWGIGYAALVTPLSPFWTATPRFDSPLGPTPPATYAFTVVVFDNNGLVAAVSDPLMLIATSVPPTASPITLPDHFKCYRAKGPFAPLEVTLADQFERRQPTSSPIPSGT